MKKVLLVLGMVVFASSLTFAQTEAAKSENKGEKAKTEKVDAKESKAKAECTKDQKSCEKSCAKSCSDSKESASAGKSEKSCSKSCCDKKASADGDKAKKAENTAQKERQRREVRSNGGAVAVKKD